MKQLLFVFEPDDLEILLLDIGHNFPLHLLLTFKLELGVPELPIEVISLPCKLLVDLVVVFQHLALLLAHVGLPLRILIKVQQFQLICL